jgi:secernin
MTPKSCDTMVALAAATHNGQTIFAKNSDRPVDECQPLVQHQRQTHPPGTQVQCQFVELPQVETTYRHVGSRPYWCWGYEHGFNEHQVVIGNEGLASKLPEATTPKLIGMEVLRLGLERGRTAAEAVEVMTDCITRYGQGKFANDAGVRTYDNGYIVADPREAYTIETAGHHWVVKRIETTSGISNVYSLETNWNRISPTAETEAIDRGWWQANSGPFNFADAYTKASRIEGSGAQRRARSCAVLGHQTGTIDPQTMMALLSDHADDPDASLQTDPGSGSGICVHCAPDGTGGNTAASLVAELCADQSQLPIYWCSFYSPCLAVFLPFFCEGQLPTILSRGNAEPSDDSPWWRFHQLARLARTQPELIPTSCQRWAAWQDQLFASANQMAIAGRQLLNAGQTTQAEQRLTDYMATNTTTMLETATELLHENTAPRAADPALRSNAGAPA